MSLAADQVVDAVVAKLAATAIAGDRVYTDDRPWPIAESQLPAWRVTAVIEPVERQYSDPAVNEHSLSISVRGIVRAVEGMRTARGALAAEGMAAVFAEPVPHDFQLDQIEYQVTTEGEAAVGAVTFTLTAKYTVDQADPETIL